jgi:hypothetical protein
MLLEIENQLHRRVHNTIGQSAVVLRLAEEIDKSGRVAEQTMIIISYSGENTNNPHKGAYIPTVRNRSLNYSITIIQKQVQREGHSFALPLMDLIYDAVTGWIPEVPGLEFQTGFEPGPGRFVEVTEASQFIYEMNFTIEILLVDGRFYSQPCAAFDPVSIDDFLPQRSCLLTPEGRKTGLAIWRRKTGVDTVEEFIVEEECDKNCAKELGDLLEITCENSLNGDGTYRFIPRIAISVSESGQTVIDESKVLQGSIKKVWKCFRGKKDPCPQWFKLNIETGLWRNTPGTVPNTDPLTSARQDFKITTKSARLSETT